MVFMVKGQWFRTPQDSEPYSDLFYQCHPSFWDLFWTAGLGLGLGFELDKNSQLLCEEEGASGNGRHLEHNKHRDWNEQRHTLLCSDSLAI